MASSYGRVVGMTIRAGRRRGVVPQPETAGYHGADVRVPNDLDPQPGEMTRRGAAGGPLFPGDEALAGVRSMASETLGPFWADRILSGLRVEPLPRFAAGGELEPGASGIVGDAGPELATAEPGGGVAIRPLGRWPGEAAALAGLGAAAQPKAAPDLAGAGRAAAPAAAALPPRPAPQTAAEDAYARDLAGVRSYATQPTEQPVGRGRHIAAILAGLGAGFFGGPARGIEAYQEIQHAPYRQEMADWNAARERAVEQAKLDQPYATEEERENAANDRSWEQAVRDSEREAADAAREQAEEARLAQQEQQFEARLAQQEQQFEDRLGESRYRDTHARPANPRQPSPPSAAAAERLRTERATKAFLDGLAAHAKTREQALAYQSKNADNLRRAGADPSAIQAFINRRWPATKANPLLDRLNQMTSGQAPAAGPQLPF